MTEFKVDPNGAQRVEYTMSDMPIRIGRNRLSAFNGFAAACHWHNDFEMLRTFDEAIDYFVNGEIVHLNKGEGIFVNARRFHYAFSARMQDCHYRFVVFHPCLFDSFPPVRQRLQALISDSAADYWRFDASSHFLLLFNELFAAADADNALRTLAKCSELLSEIAEMARPAEDGTDSEEWMLLRQMTGYIHEHYTDRLTLEQIAAAGAVSRSHCCRLFREKLRFTPIEYVNRYRLDKASLMLRRGSSVTEAALSNGFQGASYFAEIFRRAYGMSPKAYQKQARLAD